MNRLVRVCGLLVAAVVAVGQAGCLKSENVGKLEGTKWASAYIPDFHGVRNASATLQFTEGGRFFMEFRVPQGAIRASGTWRLGPGRIVYLENVAPSLDGHSSYVETISIAGDVMSFEDPDGTKIIFTRIDEEMEKAAKGATTPTGLKKNPLPGGETTERTARAARKTYD